MIKYAESKGYAVDNLVIIEDKESAIKLTEEERNGLNEMKYIINNDKSINAVFIWEISRLGRTEIVLHSIKEWLINNKINLFIFDKQYQLLNEDGTEVIDSKKLHKFDGAIYSRRTMNILGTGSLLVTAENEGICSEKHMTIYGGDISIVSGNDGINVSDDQISVFAMHDGQLNIQVSGETGEGDGIDSNGWLVINGGILNSSSCATSKDAGVDANHGIFINGGIVTATGTMEAELAKGKQAVVSFAGSNVLEAGKTYEVKDEEENVVMKVAPQNACTTVVVSSEELKEYGTYRLWSDKTLIAE